MNICEKLTPILKIVAYLLSLIQWIIPVLLIVLVTIDVFKVISGNPDQKEIEKSKNTIVRRLIYAVVVFLVPILVKMLFGFVGDAVPSDGDLDGPLDWIKCYNSVS